MRSARRSRIACRPWRRWVNTAVCRQSSSTNHRHRKSQIAIEYAYRVRDQSPAKWVFWVHAGTRARFEEGYRRIAEATKMDGWDDPKVDILRLVRSWLCDESNGQWTLVVDNADDAGVFSYDVSQSRAAGSLNQPAELLSEFLPQSPNGSILITSRSQEVARRLTGNHASNFQVKPMDMDDALALLEKKLPYTTARDEAIQLVHALDAMPLALTQAAAFISQRAPRMSVSRYLDEVGRSDKDRARLLKTDVGDSRRDGHASNSIIATWQISFEHIREKKPTAARLLSLMSMFDRQGIPESLLHNGYKVDFDDDIHILSSFSLVAMSADGSVFEMHRLVQFSTKKWLELYGELEVWRGRSSTLMDINFPLGELENWPVCQLLFPHAHAMVNNQPKDTHALKAWASVLFKAAWYMREIGQYNKAQELDFAAFEVRKSVFGAEHPYTLNSLNSLGTVLTGQGQYSKAEAVHHQVLEGRKRVLGEDHPDTLHSMGNLAVTYLYQGRWKDAEELEMQVIETSKMKLGEDHPDTLFSMGSLASTYWNQGRWKEAEELRVQVIEMSKTKLGEDHPNTLHSMGNLAVTYLSQGRWKEAEELGLQVMETRKTKLGEDHPDTLLSMGNLALTYLHQGRWKNAEKLGMQVMETRKTKLGEDHPITLTSMANLAFAWKEQGRHVEALNLLQECVQRRRRVLSVGHPDTITSSERLNDWETSQEQAI